MRVNATKNRNGDYFVKMEKNFEIRMATPLDAEELHKIYAPYVENTAISFEYEVPAVLEFRRRIETIRFKYPYLAAVEEGKIVGYAYASAFKERAAYDWAAETTIYIKEGCKGKGYGRKLYSELEKILREQNILNMNACIAYTEREDVHLTNASMRFHEKMGFNVVGKFSKCGYKFGTWYDMIWMEKLIGEHTKKPEAVIFG